MNIKLLSDLVSRQFANKLLSCSAVKGFLEDIVPNGVQVTVTVNEDRPYDTVDLAFKERNIVVWIHNDSNDADFKVEYASHIGDINKQYRCVLVPNISDEVWVEWGEDEDCDPYTLIWNTEPHISVGWTHYASFNGETGVFDIITRDEYNQEEENEDDEV